MHFTTQLLPSQAAKLGILQLNNPSSLNALTLEMIRSMTSTLNTWHAAGDNIRATLMEGAPYEKNGKAKPVFCAGGDVKAVYLAGLSKEDEVKTNGVNSSNLAADFFREEYKLNHLIATQPPHQPQVSIWDGVVMGGGVGLSIHGKYRVATENTIFAMPETKIGLFPDVGGTWWIPRLKLYNGRQREGVVGGVGNYLALTGARLKGEDLIYAGIATHFVQSERLDELKQALVESTDNSSLQFADCVAGVLMSFHDDVDLDSAFLAKNRKDIDYAFDAKDSMEDIVAALEKSNSKFAQSTLETLKQMSPTSLKVTLEGLKRGASLKGIGDALEMEYRMSQSFMKEGSDFYEGIRAALVDKCGKPKWRLKNLEEVTQEMVEGYFESLGERELCLSGGNAKL